MTDALRQINTRAPRTHQSVKDDDTQVRNNAGGFVFKLTPKAQLRRFLILGVDGGTYYQNAPALAKENAKIVFDLAKKDPETLVDEILEVATNNLAPRANPALFALAIAVAPEHNKNVDQRTRAFAALPQVARTATQLFIFLNYAQQFRGWGAGMVKAVSNWYQSKSVESQAYQIVKYRQREGWTHRDVLRQAHPKARNDEENALYHYAVSGELGESVATALAKIDGYEQAKTTPISGIPKLIEEYGLTWEMLPDVALADADVWRAMIDKGMGQTALMRQLPRLTNLEVLKGDYGKRVVKQLKDEDAIRKGRIHPMAVLFALNTYKSGHGFRGSSTWRPVTGVVNALDAAFYSAFKNVEPTGKRHLLALDVSGSMGMYTIANSNLSARDASVAMAMITAAAEDDCEVVGFTAGGGSRYSRYDNAITRLDVSPRRRLDDNIAAVVRLPFGGTDCALPMVYAQKKNLEIDQFVVYTDNETWAGSIKPHQALRDYRKASGIDAKLVVVGMTSTGFSIADPKDAGMMDVVGFDASAPALIADFVRD